MEKPFKTPRRKREVRGRDATFADLLNNGDGRWAWLYCNTMDCGHYAAIAFSPFAIRWGLEAPAAALIRRNLLCSVCGEKTTTLILPSIDVRAQGVTAFPPEHALKVPLQHAWLKPMCNLYSMNRTRDEIRGLIGALRDLTGNQPPLHGIYPDYQAPIVRMENGERIIANARWGLPSPVFALQGRNSDPGITNVRNTSSAHWKRWLGPSNRCLVPFTSFAEPETLPDGKKQNAWFAFHENRPIAFFAGVWLPQWKSVRKVKEGETTNDLYAFLTSEPNNEVGAIHPKAMPVILTKPAECDAWLSAEWREVATLQRPLPNHSLKVVARGDKKDGSP
jgi:putative SOS response-associated peptidase YedK